MQIGASIFFTDYSMAPTELGRALEERGFESMWAPGHSHIPLSRKSPFPSGGELPKQYYDAMDPFVTLSAAAAATKTLKVGTGVCLIIQRDTIQTAKSVASLDQVSGGRFLFGIGGGWNQDEMEDHGTVYATRFKKMREQIEAMREIWTKSKPEYHGETVDFPPMMTWPKPVEPAAGHRRRRLSARRAPRLALWQWLDPAFPPSAIRRRDRFPAAISANGGRGRARPGRGAGHRMGGPRECRPATALSRPRRGARRREPPRRTCCKDAAEARPLGRADPPHRALTLLEGERGTDLRLYPRLNLCGSVSLPIPDHCPMRR